MVRIAHEEGSECLRFTSSVYLIFGSLKALTGWLAHFEARAVRLENLHHRISSAKPDGQCKVKVWLIFG